MSLFQQATYSPAIIFLIYIGAAAMQTSAEPLMQKQPELTRTIWIFWKQGFENAPEVVRICLRSWKIHNPGWRVVELSDENLSEYIDQKSLANLRSLPNINIVKFANLIRLYLISRHGGVWTDATCFCCKPLDNWLPECMGSGFFAFRRRSDAWMRNPRSNALEFGRRRTDRIIASWFLASVRGNPLASIFFERHLALFATNSFSLQDSPRGVRRVKAIARVLNRNAKLSRWWAHPLVAKTAKVYPYYIIHYHFAKLVSEDELCRSIWDRTPVFLVRDLTRFSRSVPSPTTGSLLSPMTDSLLHNLTKPTTPMHKLTWKYRQEDFREGCVLDYLARSLG